MLEHESTRRSAGMGSRILNRLLGRPTRRGIDYDPYDRDTRKRLADRMFDRHRNDQPLGTVDRGKLILDIIQDSFPTEPLAAAYFENLDLLLGSRHRRETPGNILLGLGSGRTGSTTLVAILTTVPESCCTHENPPLISWTPEPEEVQFHFRRFQRLTEYFALVTDVSHWWLNVFDQLRAQFPQAKAVGVSRDLVSCARSFMKVKGVGRGSYNHWVPYQNGLWAAAQWDPTYPTYAMPEISEADPDGAKFSLITRYVSEYNEALKELAKRAPEAVMLVRSEELSEAATQHAIFDFAGVRGRVANVQLNVGTIADGRNPGYKF